MPTSRSSAATRSMDAPTGSVMETVTQIQIDVARIDERMNAHLVASQKTWELLDNVSAKLTEIGRQVELNRIDERNCLDDMSDRLDRMERMLNKHLSDHADAQNEQEKYVEAQRAARASDNRDVRKMLLEKSITVRHAVILAILTVVLSVTSEVILTMVMRLIK